MEHHHVKECVACGIDFATEYDFASLCRACEGGNVAEARAAKRRLDERAANRAREKATALAGIDRELAAT